MKRLPTFQKTVGRPEWLAHRRNARAAPYERDGAGVPQTQVTAAASLVWAVGSTAGAYPCSVVILLDTSRSTWPATS